jgi:hypothetical protein
VPEVGLEPDSSPCEHWEVPETSPIRPDPPPVRPSPEPKVCILCTPPALRFKGPRRTTAPRVDGARFFFVLTKLSRPEDLFGCLGPGEGGGVGVPFADPFTDVGLEHLDAAVNAVAWCSLLPTSSPQ